jgi:hypothetical protein
MKLRELHFEDLEAVARLFLRTFRPKLAATAPPPASLIAYLDELFLRHKLADAASPSLVAYGDVPDLMGFIGVLPLRMTIRDRPIRAAICTTLMVRDPDRNPMVAAQLMRRVINGTQDLTLGDTAIHGAQAMWERLGGRSLPLYSLGWTRVLRPAAYLLDRLGLRAAGLATLIDPISERLWRSVSGAGERPSLDVEPQDVRITTRDADPAHLAEVMPILEKPMALRPDWSGGTLEWILAQALRREIDGPLVMKVVQGTDGTPIGAYLYYGMPGRTANVLHIATTSRGVEATLGSLLSDAHRKGMAAVKGGAQPALMSELFRHQCFFRYRGATVYHSRDPQVLEAIVQGNAVIGGLVGERWTKLDADSFS